MGPICTVGITKFFIPLLKNRHYSLWVSRRHRALSESGVRRASFAATCVAAAAYAGFVGSHAAAGVPFATVTQICQTGELAVPMGRTAKIFQVGVGLVRFKLVPFWKGHMRI